jgi:hypothetical protein
MNNAATLATQLIDLTAEATTPNGKLSARLHAREPEVLLTFHDNSYYRYAEPELAIQIEGLARLLSVAWARVYWHQMSLIHGRTITHEDPPATAAEQRFRDLRAEMHVSASSPDGRIHLDYQAGHDGWRITIEPGTLATLSEEQFVESARLATHALFAAHRSYITTIRRECFPPPESLPRW